MTIEFMILAAPRSGTTWASNWLTTDTTLCLHDPLWRWSKEELDSIQSPRRLGIACTGLALFPEWVNAHSARKIILHRDLKEMDQSLKRIGMTGCSEQWEGVLDRIKGVHLEWSDLFTRPQYIYEFLLDLPFDPERWTTLREMNVQPHYESVTVNQSATARLMAELRAH
ncbi:MAG TPA: hypothetical protein VHK27_10925 [Gammaproteobacteria bacterium]|nr:hypothetical protein [Gammaproteobacteria bacterium]